MSDIKVGDLVMIVKPTVCCGYAGRIGRVFRAGRFNTKSAKCSLCGARATSFVGVLNPESGKFVDVVRLIKIDPPAEGDSLPTRADLEVTD